MSRQSNITNHVLISLTLAFICFTFGGLFVTPLTPSKRVVIYGPEGRTSRLKTEEELRADNLRVFRANWRACAFYAAGTASLGWCLISISYGIVRFVRTKRQVEARKGLIMPMHFDMLMEFLRDVVAVGGGAVAPKIAKIGAHEEMIKLLCSKVAYGCREQIDPLTTIEWAFYLPMPGENPAFQRLAENYGVTEWFSARGTKYLLRVEQLDNVQRQKVRSFLLDSIPRRPHVYPSRLGLFIMRVENFFSKRRNKPVR